MSNLVKYQEPKSLLHAVDLAYNQKQWASKYSDEELKTLLAPIINEAGEALRQTKSLTHGEINAIYKGLIDRIRGTYKTLHIFEIQKAIRNWIYDGSDDVKIFSAANLVKALSKYDKDQRHKLIRETWKNPEEEKKELTDQEKQKQIDSFYELWKKCNSVKEHQDFFGYTAVFKLLRELDMVDTDKDYYWSIVEEAKPLAIDSLKNKQVDRSISQVLYKSHMEAIQELTYDNFYKKGSMVNCASLEYECQRLIVLAYFMERQMNDD